MATAAANQRRGTTNKSVPVSSLLCMHERPHCFTASQVYLYPDAALRDVVMGTMVIITTKVIPIDCAIIMNKAFT